MKNLKLTYEHIKLITLLSLLSDNLAGAFFGADSVLGMILHMLGKIWIPLVFVILFGGIRLTPAVNHKSLRYQIYAFALLYAIPFFIYLKYTVTFKAIKEYYTELGPAAWILNVIGVLLGIAVARLYSGEKGKYIFFRSFLFWLILSHTFFIFAIKGLIYGTPFQIYLGVHLTVVVICFSMLVLAMFHRSSRGQMAMVFFLFSAMIYLVGFVIEILSSSEEGYYLACIVEYFGEALLFIALLYYTQILCKLKIPYFAYAAQFVISLCAVCGVITYRKNHIFYKTLSVAYDGPFPHLRLEYGIGFFAWISYIVLLSIILITLMIITAKKTQGFEKKRIVLSVVCFIFCWIPYVLKLTGITGTYEIPAIGMGVAGIGLFLVITRYGFMDSLTRAGELVVDSGSYGILVTDSTYKLQYQNPQIMKILGRLEIDSDLRENPILSKILKGEINMIRTVDKVYDVRVDEFKEKNIRQGYMIWVFDNTDHYYALEKIKEIAERDPLTKLYNRNVFQERMEEHLKAGGTGTFIMMDVDNFKQVNDKYGHKIGDAVLLLLANVLKAYRDDELLTCRIGGDEFAGFFVDVTDEDKVKDTITDIMTNFAKQLEGNGYKGYTSISVGALICDKDKSKEADFDTFYTGADALMYTVKRAGKNKYLVKSM